MSVSPQQLMIVSAAREIADGDVVFVGMRLPIVAFGVAKLTHAPTAVGVFECGIVRNEPAAGMIYTMGDPWNQSGAVWATGLVQAMGQLHKGRVDAGFIGAAEIDRFGNINTSYIGDPARPTVKLPGSGGGADIAAMAKRLICAVAHDRRRLVERVSFVTSPGWLDGSDSRRRAGLKQGGTAAVITDRAILRPHGDSRELHLASLHRGQSLEEVRANTGWDVKTLPDLAETLPPSTEELAALRAVDPDGFWH
jgi:glutaconate CoA-transferase, subunit B